MERVAVDTFVVDITVAVGKPTANIVVVEGFVLDIMEV